MTRTECENKIKRKRERDEEKVKTMREMYLKRWLRRDME